MPLKISKHVLTHQNFQVNALSFYYPDDEKQNNKPHWALFTHGYTANKTDQLTWAIRLAEAGIPSLIFDLPGHYLGNFQDVKNFEQFTESAHELFIAAYQTLKKDLGDIVCEYLILGGHSLGALLACHALKLDFFTQQKKIAIAVGFGLTDEDKTHLFATKFYEKTLNIRRQLVSPSIDSDKIFPWIKSEKEKLTLSNQRLHLITGEDDVVVGVRGVERLAEKLVTQGNQVSFEKPNKLPHHQPELAASHIYAFLKKELSLT